MYSICPHHKESIQVSSCKILPIHAYFLVFLHVSYGCMKFCTSHLENWIEEVMPATFSLFYEFYFELSCQCTLGGTF